jgi:hypothetical protein
VSGDTTGEKSCGDKEAQNDGDGDGDGEDGWKDNGWMGWTVKSKATKQTGVNHRVAQVISGKN